MNTPYVLFRLLALSLVLVLLGTKPSSAQLQYATSVVSFANTTNAARAVDDSPRTAARLSPSLLAGDASLRLGFPSNVAPGTQAGLLLRVGQVLNVSALSTIRVRTYQTAVSATTPQQSFALSDLLTASTLSTDTTMLMFPVGVAFNQVEITASDLLNLRYNIDVFDAFGTATPLPVVLTAFQGRATATGVTLSWATASEYQANYFEVQRATGTPGAFAVLGRVQCTGSRTQGQQYQYQDQDAVSGVTYYRLRQVDLNGHDVFSPVVTVEAALTTPDFVAYPSLATTQLTVVAPAGTPLGIFDQLGRQWQQATSTPAQPLDVRALPSGVYFVRDLVTGKSTRFVKAASGMQP